MEPLEPLSLSSPILNIDGRIATRRMGVQVKGPPAWVVLKESMGIETVEQLLHHYPRAYIDREQADRISHLRVGERATVIARVSNVDKRQMKRRKNQVLVTVTLKDRSGTLSLPFFNQPWLATTYRVGMEVAASGVVQVYARKFQLADLEVEILRSDDQDLIHTRRITPVHRVAEGVSTRTVRALIYSALETIPAQPDPLPAEIVEAEGLSDWNEALHRIHFPDDRSQLSAARERLKFDELFLLELGVGYRKQRLAAERKGVEHEPEGELTGKLVASVPFEPTKAQFKAMEAVSNAMAAPSPMNVLLQGDVGSGKTLVAVHACLVAVQSGHQAAIMAPTEVLAGQHLRSVAHLLDGLGAARYTGDNPGAARAAERGAQPSLFSGGEAPPLTYALLTGAVTGKDREKVLEGVASGAVDLVIGTHALVQEGVAFRDLSLAVVDEQHRFGLHQRMALKDKGGGDVDVLIMTATPIPRTLALTYYGDLDVVVLDEMPKGRLPIETRAARSAAERRQAEDLVRREVAAGHQAFVVCAAIDEDNKNQVKAAEAEAERLRTEVFPDLRVELLHGRMRPKEKERIMDQFRSGEADVLISTTVIEVGVDVPNATVMLVENAERFGLAQLHQLRGRIGRGSHESSCILFDESGPDNLEARSRIDAMVATTDGFELADEDLRLRGEGTLFDTKQSGMPDLKLARLVRDFSLVKRARTRAFSLLDEDPGLRRHADLQAELRRRFEGSIDWLFAS